MRFRAKLAQSHIQKFVNRYNMNETVMDPIKELQRDSRLQTKVSVYLSGAWIGYIIVVTQYSETMSETISIGIFCKFNFIMTFTEKITGHFPEKTEAGSLNTLIQY